MGCPKRLVLVRHAQSVGNVLAVDERAECDLATYAYPLTERGRKQAAFTGEYLRERFNEFNAYYVSYYTRAQETMEIMYPRAKGYHAYEDARLAEGQRGIWHTMTDEEIGKKFPEEVARKEREGLYHYRPWGGENWLDIELRIHSFLMTLNQEYDDENVLVVGHGHLFLLFQRILDQLSIGEVLKRYEKAIVENASVTIYEPELIKNKSRLVLKEHNIVPWQGKF